jgi:hypothetical protein
MANGNNNLELKIFVTALLLQELLDETIGETRFKHQLRRDINNMTKGLDNMLTVKLDNNVSLLINKATNALETAIEEELE